MKSLASTAAKYTLFFFYKSWLVWACAALFYCYQFMLRVSPGVMAEDLMESFHVDGCALGALSGFYYYTYSALQIPVGALMDHFKPRRLLTFAAIFCSVGALVFSSADSLTIACIGRGMIGVGSAFAFLSCLKLGTLWFPANKLPFVVGMTLLLGTAGGISAGYPMGWLVEAFNWREAMWLVAFAGFGLAFLAWTVVRDTPPAHIEDVVLKSHGEKGSHVPTSGFLEGIIEVTRKPQSWLIALYGGLMYLPLSGFTDLWGPSFLMSTYGFDKATAGFVNSILYFGVGLGSPLFPFLCQGLRAYKPTILISAMGALVCFSIVCYVPGLPFSLLVTSLFLGGFFLGGQFLAFSMTCALNPLSASGTAGGFHNMMCMLSGAIFQPLIGQLLDYTWNGTTAGAVRIYSLGNYQFAFSSITLSLLLSCIVICFIKEQYKK